MSPGVSVSPGARTARTHERMHARMHGKRGVVRVRLRANARAHARTARVTMAVAVAVAVAEAVAVAVAEAEAEVEAEAEAVGGHTSGGGGRGGGGQKWRQWQGPRGSDDSERQGRCWRRRPSRTDCMRFCCETISFSVYSMSFMILRGTACAREVHVHDCWHGQERLGAPVKALRLDLQVFDGLRHGVFAVGALVRPKARWGRAADHDAAAGHGTRDGFLYLFQTTSKNVSERPHQRGSTNTTETCGRFVRSPAMLHPLSPLPGLVG